MALTSDEVRHIARLARLGLSGDEVARFEGQLSAILDHVRALEAIDTEGVPPTAQSFELSNVEREDESRPSLDREALFANAPRREDSYLRVRAVLE